MDIKVPNLGDGVDEATIISILVKPGDTVEESQTLLEIETDKAVAPLPCPQAGVIGSITVEEGDTISEGVTVGTLEAGGSQAAAPAEAPEPAKAAPAAAAAPVTAPVVAATPVQAQPVPSQGVPVSVQRNENPVTSPSLAKLAYRIGLDLSLIQGTEAGGRISEADIRAHVQKLEQLLLAPPVVAPVAAAPVAPVPVAEKKKVTPLPDFSKFGEISVEKCSSLRKKIASKMTETWQTVPAVTQNIEVDITTIMDYRKAYNPEYIEETGSKLTVTVFALRAVERTLAQFPHFNASYDAEANELILKRYCHLGVAVDTESGLIVPVIKNVNEKNLMDLTEELAIIAEKAKARTLTAEELQGGTFTISNLGGLGVGAFTPIINTPEVAILGMGAGEMKPVLRVVDDKKKVTFKLKMPLCLTYDHRVIDGADAARFMLELKRQFEEFPESEL